MTIPRIEAVGFCAHYSEQGDWAFDYALNLAREHDLQLNVFHFLSDPYVPDDDTERLLPAEELADLAIAKEREMRLYYDERAGEFLDVGFRLCYDNSWRELHRCLAGREFQLLVLAKPLAECEFAGKPIDEFANSFVCPVILVGPDRPDQFSLNSSAALRSDRIPVPADSWRRIEIGSG
jgi:hypothetical protein